MTMYRYRVFCGVQNGRHILCGRGVKAAMRHSCKKLDLTGQRFGKLVVLEPAENIGRKTAWRCRCDCGTETVVVTGRLRDGRRVSCGCDSGHIGESPAEIGRASLNYIDGTCVELIRSKTIRCNNTSGVPGVDWRPSKGMWRATICFKGKRHYLGSFRNFEDAVKARKQGEKQFYESFLREFDEQLAGQDGRQVKQAASHVNLPPSGG